MFHSTSTLAKLSMLAGVSALAMMTGSTAMAQVPSSRASAAAPEEIIVTARKREESLMKAPVLIQAISSKQIEDLHITKIESLSTAVPGAFIRYGFALVGITAYIRGLGNSPQAITTDQTISLNIDGFTSASGVLFRTGIFDAAQIEVLKGPQSLFFGKSTAAGVIAISSADPTSEWESKVNVGYEFNADEIDINGYVSGPITDNLGVRLAGYHREMKGYFYDPKLSGTAKRVPGEDDNGARLTLKYDNSDAGLRVKLKAAYTHSRSNNSVFELNQRVCASPPPLFTTPLDNCVLDNRGAGTPDGLPYNPNFSFSRDIAAAPEWDRFTGSPLFKDGQSYNYTTAALGVLSIDYEVAEGLTASSVTALSYVKAVDAGVNAGIIGLIDIAADPKYHEWSQEVRLTSNWKDSWINFMVGGLHNEQLRKDHAYLQFRNNFLPEVTRFVRGSYDIIEGDSNSVFGQLLLTPIPEWEFSAGVRYTKVNKAYRTVQFQTNLGIPFLVGEQLQNIPQNRRKFSEDNTTPEATLSYKPTEDFTAFISYKHGYKGPAIGPLNAAFSVDQPIRGEKAKGFEGGIKAQLFDRQLALTATGYRYNYTDLQVSFIEPVLSAAIIANAASTRVQGIELGLDYKPVDVPGLTLNAFLNYNDTYYKSFNRASCYIGQSPAQGCVGGLQDLSGRTLSMAPKLVGNLGGSYSWNLNDDYIASVNAQLQYSSSYLASADLNAFGRQGSYVVMDAGVRVGKVNDAWELALLCRNCNDKIYATNGTDGSSVPPSTIINIARPRQVLLQLTVKPNLL